MKEALILNLPDDVRERLDAIAEYYGLPGDFLCQKFIVDVVNGIYTGELATLEKVKREAQG